MSEPIPQEAIDTLPEGYTILGWGGDFKYNGAYCNKDIKCIGPLPVFGKWADDEETDPPEDSPTILFAAPTDSEIVKLNHKNGKLPYYDGMKLPDNGVWRVYEGISGKIKIEGGKKDIFPTDAEERKTYPIGTFIKDYFPNALAALAHHSYISQAQHGPTTNGAPMEWLKDKSVGDGNQIIRHYMEGDYENMAWRALELLERELTEEQKNG